ncbi:hypothetical protein [Roseovarius sp. D0-M9]|uniref:hypothetical protein n=1 Tax=Roseovarius sp. D0-M9 TaxID=3127117 RepID=UPI00300F9AC0
MADNSVVHIGENSPEQVAFRLTTIIAVAEGKDMNLARANVDRKWLLDTYSECLQAVNGHRAWEG